MKIYVVNKTLENSLKTKNANTILVTASSSWEELDLKTKLVLIENKLKTKEDFVPLSEEEAVGLPPTTKVRWHEEIASPTIWMDLYRQDVFRYGTIAEYKRIKGKVVPSPKYSDESEYYITKCDDPCRVIEISDTWPVYSLGIKGDGSFYGACPLTSPDSLSIWELFGEDYRALSLREKFLLAHAMGGKEAIYNLGQELRVPDQIIKEVVDNIDTL